MRCSPTLLHAYNLIRHAMTRLDFGGETVYLEQDVLAFAVDGRIHVVEIKSYPRIDGRADPVKASATVRQTAVYVLSLQQLMVEIGATAQRGQHHHDDRAAGKPLLPTDRGDNRDRHVRASAAPPTRVGSAGDRDHRRHSPPGPGCQLTLPNEAGSDEVATAVTAAREALAPLPPRFTDGCVSCPLFHHCRDEAELHHSTARLGSAVAGACGNVTEIAAALDLAAGRRTPADASEAAVAADLARGAAAARLAVGGLA